MTRFLAGSTRVDLDAAVIGGWDGAVEAGVPTTTSALHVSDEFVDSIDDYSGIGRNRWERCPLDDRICGVP